MTDGTTTTTLGVDWIDAAHRLVTRRAQRVVSAAAQGSAEELRGALGVLAATLADHWGDEEGWMADQGYPAIGEHGRLHRELLDRVAELRAVARARGPAARAAEDLALAIEEHLRTEDPKLARFAAARENLRRLADARGGKGPALTPIPGALTPVPARTPRPASLTPVPLAGAKAPERK